MRFHARLAAVSLLAVTASAMSLRGRGPVTSIEDPNSGLPNSGVPNSGVPNSGLPNSGVPNSGVPNSGVPSSGVPNSGVPNSGVPNSGVPNSGLPNSLPPGTSGAAPNSGLPNSGLPNSLPNSLPPGTSGAEPNSCGASNPPGQQMCGDGSCCSEYGWWYVYQRLTRHISSTNPTTTAEPAPTTAAPAVNLIMAHAQAAHQQR